MRVCDMRRFSLRVTMSLMMMWFTGKTEYKTVYNQK